jgi:hypothetical protein
MLAASGYDFDQLKQQALKKEFQPVVLKAQADFRSTTRRAA